jgi:O-antigen/teichoic acid export membrane protein
MNTHNNRRIAKNSFFLYIRMFLLLGITLYTSRIVLNTLGVEDYGIYNVVGGVVAMLSFINTSLTSATQRYLNYEMGKNDGKGLSKVFSTAITAHFLIGLGIVIIGETIGLWFVKTHLTIPEDRLISALWVYHFSIFTIFISIVSTPYNAAIIAHERMKVYAYISIVEACLKLIIVFLLIYVAIDKLILYSALLLLVSIVIRTIYTLYCRNNFSECRFRFVWDQILIVEMLNYSGWMFIGTFSSMMKKQGVNILINIFFNPVHNAARGIAVQVQTAINMFASNFMIAVKPQIVKSYAVGNNDYMHELVYLSSKFSFFLLYFISLPVLLNTEFILKFWLNMVPEYSVVFVKLVLIDTLIYTLFDPIGTIAKASGRIRNYQLAVSICFMLEFLLVYIAFKLGFPSFTAFIVLIIIDIFGLFVRLYILHSSYSFSFKSYFKKVLIKVIFIGIIGFFVPFYVTKYFADESAKQLIFSSLSSVFILSILIWFFGLNLKERKFINSYVSQIKGKF